MTETPGVHLSYAAKLSKNWGPPLFKTFTPGPPCNGGGRRVTSRLHGAQPALRSTRGGGFWGGHRWRTLGGRRGYSAPRILLLVHAVNPLFCQPKIAAVPQSNRRQA